MEKMGLIICYPLETCSYSQQLSTIILSDPHPMGSRAETWDDQTYPAGQVSKPPSTTGPANNTEWAMCESRPLEFGHYISSPSLCNQDWRLSQEWVTSVWLPRGKVNAWPLKWVCLPEDRHLESNFTVHVNVSYPLFRVNSGNLTFHSHNLSRNW